MDDGEDQYDGKFRSKKGPNKEIPDTQSHSGAFGLSGDIACPLTPCLRRMSTIPRMVKQITVSPPMAPPTIGPRFIGSWLEEVGIGPDVDEEFITELERDAGTENVSTTVAFGCEAELVKELLGTEVGLDGVVVASAAFGTGRSVSVRVSAPQAMYS
ncbi:hypothetical protein P153DRAFT_381249 [Dothidotthia symphoricarpi CBS 119687]|uniref:Uncharacterized protein n=1 Tax=Dothidotthia symphoricarpi CBS 119687 TaxID=1392245 RepID=A0A6A6AT98_9PLEO|nr:uncharacterized protein P153DRAFT_381249 [Dothidotthia symphoricarpi CBS 119687]KAF2134077.1 hypothetical protein P153DRAFT_381249 [Dothidotthia symphoricarpi CBS 119687]